jgi:hypothetical protein
MSLSCRFYRVHAAEKSLSFHKNFAHQAFDVVNKDKKNEAQTYDMM